MKMELTSLRTLFVSELQDIYSAEQQLVKALPNLAKAASDESLKGVFTTNLTWTENQVRRIEEIFQSIGEKAKTSKCEAMAGMITEGDEVIKAAKGACADTVDAALIGAARKAGHYEIASYGSLCSYADVLRQPEAARLLRETLQEVKDTDQQLNNLATDRINQKANHLMNQPGTKHHRIFVSAPSKDAAARDQFIRTHNFSDCDFVDGQAISASTPGWEKQCDDAMQGCDGVIAFVTNNTYDSKCQSHVVARARKNNIPVHAFYLDEKNRPTLLPTAFSGLVLTAGTDEHIKKFVEGIK
jgi:ferritin-like metal-binding protein YciE